MNFGSECHSCVLVRMRPLRKEFSWNPIQSKANCWECFWHTCLKISAFLVINLEKAATITVTTWYLHNFLRRNNSFIRYSRCKVIQVVPILEWPFWRKFASVETVCCRKQSPTSSENSNVGESPSFLPSIGCFFLPRALTQSFFYFFIRSCSTFCFFSSESFAWVFWVFRNTSQRLLWSKRHRQNVRVWMNAVS